MGKLSCTTTEGRYEVPSGNRHMGGQVSDSCKHLFINGTVYKWRLFMNNMRDQEGNPEHDVIGSLGGSTP